jgi:hypothetical protein
VNLSDDQKLELANVDFAGIHQQHAAALGSFNTMLQIVLAIEALPWVVLGALYSRTGSQADPETLIFQHVMPFIFLLTFVVAVIGYMILVNNRLMVIYYARALNGYRAFFADRLPVGKFLPVTLSTPRRRESGGIMLLLAVALGIINALYLFLALYAWLSVFSAAILVVSVLALICVWYLYATR